ncbi:MAG: GNAT family N-acetyltransferase [Candidatus Aphodocola sp.]
MNFYVGSGMKNCELVNYYAKILKENNWNQTYNWVENINDDVSIEDMTKYAILEAKGIVDSDVVIILLPAGRGAHIELGMALALNKKIFLCSATKDEFNVENTVAFYGLPNIVQLVGTADENINQIITLSNHNIKIKEFNSHDKLVDFYISRGIEFNDDRQYFHPPIFSYIAEIDNTFVGAITVCKEDNNFILDEVAVIEGKERQGICTSLVNTAINRIEQEYGDNKFYLVAKNPDIFKSMGFNIIKRDEDLSFSECFSCPDFKNKCFPEIMVKILKK